MECGGEYAAGSGTAFGSGEFMVPESSQEAGSGYGEQELVGLVSVEGS